MCTVFPDITLHTCFMLSCAGTCAYVMGSYLKNEWVDTQLGFLQFISSACAYVIPCAVKIQFTTRISSFMYVVHVSSFIQCRYVAGCIHQWLLTCWTFTKYAESHSVWQERLRCVVFDLKRCSHPWSWMAAQIPSQWLASSARSNCTCACDQIISRLTIMNHDSLVVFEQDVTRHVLSAPDRSSVVHVRVHGEPSAVCTDQLWWWANYRSTWVWWCTCPSDWCWRQPCFCFHSIPTSESRLIIAAALKNLLRTISSSKETSRSTHCLCIMQQQP